MAPLRAWPVAVDLDAVALGVVEVERLADEMVRGAGQPPAGARRPRKGPGERGPPRDQDREVKQPRCSGRALGGPGARDELHHHRAVDAQPEGPPRPRPARAARSRARRTRACERDRRREGARRPASSAPDPGDGSRWAPGPRFRRAPIRIEPTTATSETGTAADGSVDGVWQVARWR